ncbi:MAG: NAD(P)-dependent oxidoreductase [Dehalococcoidia bacterium]|nr:NAD(P)-dependent oxidoreductase [Dehalococcoidia bacterium]
MTVYISDCGGVLGPPLVRWLLEHSEAAIVGTNTDHENMGPLLAASRFRFYVVADRDDSTLLRRVSDHPDVVVVLSAVERPSDDSVHIRSRAELVESCAEIGARLIYVTPEWGDGIEDIPPDSSLSRVIRAEAERDTRELILSYGTDRLSWVVLQVFDVLDSRLQARPVRHSPPLLETLTHALRERSSWEVALDAEDLVPRVFTYVDEVAECIGRAVLADGNTLNGQVVDVGHPANVASLAEVGQLALGRAAQHRPGEEVPTLAPPADRPPLPAAPEVNISRAQMLLDWHARRTLRDIVDSGVRRLIEETRET